MSGQNRQKNYFEETEYWTYQQQRFEAALKFMEIKMVHGSGTVKIGDTVQQSICLADLLLAKLEESRTKREGE